MFWVPNALCSGCSPVYDRVLGNTRNAADVLDEHLLHEPVRLPVVLVVMPLSHFTDLGELGVSKRASTVAECLERVYCLAGHHDVANEAKEIALARGVSQISRFAEDRTKNFLAFAGIGAKALLIVLEHSLVFAHSRDVPAAEVTKPSILCLLLMTFERFEKRSVLHDRVVYLAFQKVETTIHLSSSRFRWI